MRKNFAVAIVSGNSAAVLRTTAGAQYWQSKSRVMVDDPGSATEPALNLGANCIAIIAVDLGILAWKQCSPSTESGSS